MSDDLLEEIFATWPCSILKFHVQRYSMVFNVNSMLFHWNFIFCHVTSCSKFRQAFCHASWQGEQPAAAANGAPDDVPPLRCNVL